VNGNYSRAGFELGHFLRASHDVSFLSDIAAIPSPYRSAFSRTLDLYRLGCLLEDRVLTALGVRLGVFEAETATALLREEDAQLQSFLSNELITEDSLRLPAFLSTEDLLNSEGMAESSDANELRSELRFRSYIGTLGLDALYGSLLFASDETWSSQIESTRSRGDEILNSSSSYPGPIARIYEAVQLCADMLDWRRGNPIGSSDPWGVSPGIDRPSVYRLHLRHLSKTDEDTPARVELSAQEVRSSESAASSVTVELLDETLLLKVLHFARLPELTHEDIETSRRRIISALLPADQVHLVQRFGEQFSWASWLWRIAPTDERSLNRASEAAALMSEFVETLIRSEQ
jgi:hypothetical protein